jgi:hypothetical protein
MRLHVALLASVLVACADEPPPRTPRHKPQPPPTGEQDNAAAIARMQAAQDDENAAAMADTRAAQKKADAYRERQRSEQEERRKACEGTRPVRVASVKTIVTERLQAETRLLTHAVAIRKACKLTDKPTGAVTVRAGRIAPEMADDVTCSTLPAGLTKADAYVVLWRVRDSGDPGPTGAMLDRSDLTAEDEACKAFDVEAGVDFEGIRWGDDASYRALVGK